MALRPLFLVVVRISTVIGTQNILEFENYEDIGRRLDRYNGAIGLDCFEDKQFKKEHLAIITKQILKEFGGHLNCGIKLKYGNRRWLVSHFIISFGVENKFALVIHIKNKPLSVNELHDIERLIKLTDLQGVIIVAKKFGSHSINEIRRLNTENDQKIIVEQLGSLIKRYQFCKFGVSAEFL